MTSKNPNAFVFRAGDKAIFKRGMYGWWMGKVVRVFTSKRTLHHYDRIPVAEVAFIRRNGTKGSRVVAVSSLLIPVTETMAIDTRGGAVEFERGTFSPAVP